MPTETSGTRTPARAAVAAPTWVHVGFVAETTATCLTARAPPALAPVSSSKPVRSLGSSAGETAVLAAPTLEH